MPVVREVPEGTRVFLRVIDYPRAKASSWASTSSRSCEHHRRVDVASHKSAHTKLPLNVLRAELEAAGFERIELFGCHDRQPLKSTPTRAFSWSPAGSSGRTAA